MRRGAGFLLPGASIRALWVDDRKLGSVPQRVGQGF